LSVTLFQFYISWFFRSLSRHHFLISHNSWPSAPCNSQRFRSKSGGLLLHLITLNYTHTR